MESILGSPFACVLLVTCGLACLFLELFIPSGGILGILAVGCTGLGIYGFFDQGQTALGFFAIIATIGFTAFTIRFWLKRVTLKGVMTPATSSGADRSLKALLGEEGIAQTELRPAGAVRLGGKKVDVVSAGSFITRGARVKVIDVSGNRVVVREIAPHAEADDAVSDETGTN